MKSVAAFTLPIFMIVGAITIVTVACGDTGDGTGSKRGVLLFQGMSSGTSPDDVGTDLRNRGFSWEVIEKNDLDPGDKRPRFSILRWRVSGLGTNEFKGDSELLFFNDRLARVVFYPSDPNAYIEHVKDTANGRVHEAARMKNDPRGSVFIEIPQRGNPWVWYEDSRLIEDLNDWISKYS